VTSSSLVQPPRAPTLLGRGHPVAATRPIRSLAFLALGIMLSGPPSFRLGGGRDPGAALDVAAAVDGAVAIQAALVGAAAITGFVLLGRHAIRLRLKELLFGNRGGRFTGGLLAVWILLSGVSVLWSMSPAFTVYSWTRFAGTTALYLVVIALGRDLYTVIRFTFWYSLAKMATILVALLLAPHLVTTTSGRLIGSPLWTDYGSSGLFLTLAIFSLVGLGKTTEARKRGIESYLARSPILVTVLLATAGSYVLASQTRSTMWPLLLLYAMTAYFFRLRLAVWAGAIVVFGLAMTTRAAQAVLATLTRSSENPFDPSARDEAFGYTVHWAAQRGFGGSGFGAGSRAAMVDYNRFVRPGMGASHDGFSKVFADLGYPGTLLQIVTILALLCGFYVGIRLARVRSARPLLLFSTFWLLHSAPLGGVDATSGFSLILLALTLRLSGTSVPDGFEGVERADSGATSNLQPPRQSGGPARPLDKSPL
jgi:hypothetical protein